jgi:hypothetical protein
MTDDELAAVVAAAAIVAARSATAPGALPKSRRREIEHAMPVESPKSSRWKMSGRILD